VLTLACLQDLSQARSRWGRRPRIPFPVLDHGGPAGHRGPSHPGTALAVGGANAREHTHHPVGPRGRSAGHSTSWIERDRATVGELARGRPGFGLAWTPQRHEVDRTDPRAPPPTLRASARPLGPGAGAISRALSPRGQFALVQGRALARAPRQPCEPATQRSSPREPRATLAVREERSTTAVSSRGDWPKLAASATPPRRDDVPRRGGLRAPTRTRARPDRPAIAAAFGSHPRLETLEVAAPSLDRLCSLPRELLSTSLMMPSPESPVSLVNSLHVLDAVEGPPGDPRRALAQFVTKRRPVQRVRAGAWAKRARLSSTFRAPSGRAPTSTWS